MNAEPTTRSALGRNTAKHTRTGPEREPLTLSERRNGIKAREYMWHTTKPRPWKLRAERHAANRRARASRKANR